MTDTLPYLPVDALQPAAFTARHIGPQPDERDKMLAALGLTDLDELVDQSMPKAIRMDRPLDLPPAQSESQTLAGLRELAAQNNPLTAMIGLGYYGTITPSVIRRNVLEAPAWYTAYTPYQPEISQGRLEALLNFQTMVSDLTGLPHRRRQPARRGHSRGRGDDPGSPQRQDGPGAAGRRATSCPRPGGW